MTGRWTRERLLDLVFVVGFAFKAVDGLVELVAGTLLLVFRPAQVEAVARWLTAGELREDPTDPVAHLLRRGAAALSADTATVAAVYLLVHGAVKLVIVGAIVRGSRRLYPWAVAALSGFVVWQAWQLVAHPGVALALLTLFDVAIVALTVREWRHHRSLGQAYRDLRRPARPARPGPRTSAGR